jgi:hypothetical protein
LSKRFGLSLLAFRLYLSLAFLSFILSWRKAIFARSVPQIKQTDSKSSVGEKGSTTRGRLVFLQRQQKPFITALPLVVDAMILADP